MGKGISPKAGHALVCRRLKDASSFLVLGNGQLAATKAFRLA
jgi:hypothetical protein